MHRTPQLNRMIHENFLTVLSYAFSAPSVRRVIEECFAGEWGPLNDTTNEMAELRADRALLELAVQLRVLDDQEGINEYLKRSGKPLIFGEVLQGDNTATPLFFRDLTNKILHADRFNWVFGSDNDPQVTLFSRDPKHWQRAKVSIVAMMAFVGRIGY